LAFTARNAIVNAAIFTGENLADFVPLIGDAKAIKEAADDPTAINIIAAGVGFVPGGGDFASKGIKKFGKPIAEAGAALRIGGDAFEAAAKKAFAKRIIRQNEVLRDASGKVIGEIDFETAEALVEVGVSLGGKSMQLFRLAEIASARAKRLDVLFDPRTTPRARLNELTEQLRGKFGNRVRFIPFTE
jgi:uncharacterized spore protein YtfJ